MNLKDIPGYEGLYAINKDDGRVWSYPKRYSSKEGKWLSEKVSKRGYTYVNLYKEGYKKMFRVSRLVAETWIKNPFNLPQVNHINGIKTDNKPDNLEWCTQEENLEHAFQVGLHNNPKKKVINNLGIVYESIQEASRRCNISATSISRCCRGEKESVKDLTWRFYTNKESKFKILLRRLFIWIFNR